MRIRQLRLNGVQSFGPDPTTVDLEEPTYLLGPNGSGRTAVLDSTPSPLQVLTHREAAAPGNGSNLCGHM